MHLFLKADNINENELYMIDLYEINTILHVLCTYKAYFACDMKIIYMEKNNKNVKDNIGDTISYRYEWNLESIYFRSFAYSDKCKIYKIILSQ
jgi:hypothetical protein